MLGITSELYLFAQKYVPKGLAVAELERTESARQPRKPLILMVDDQHLIADTTTMVLNRSGFRAQCAYSGRSALEMALKLKPDYLLTDIIMPGMNGVDLAICVRNGYDHRPPIRSGGHYRPSSRSEGGRLRV